MKNMNRESNEQILKEILKLSKEKLSKYVVVAVEQSGGESGAYYGSIVFRGNDMPMFRTGYVFYLPNHLSLTSSIKEIDDRYLNYCNKQK